MATLIPSLSSPGAGRHSFFYSRRWLGSLKFQPPPPSPAISRKTWRCHEDPFEAGKPCPGTAAEPGQAHGLRGYVTENPPALSHCVPPSAP